MDLYDDASPQLQKFVCNLNDFQIDKEIGSGGFGKVFLATHRPTGMKCAVKKLTCDEMTDQDVILYQRENEILATINNRFCLNFLGWTPCAPFIIVTEYIPKGSLYAALRKKRRAPQLTPTDKTIIAIGVAKALMHLHSLGIIHRDIKSLNVLLDEKLYPIVCDFGLSRFEHEKGQDEGDDFKTKDIGTPHWMAPELFMTSTYDNKVDVYAYGMLVWEMIAEAAPFENMTGVQIGFAVCNKGERPAFPNKTPPALKEFVKKLWDQEASRRPTMAQAFKRLKKHQVEFAGTDREKVDEFLAFLKKDEHQRKKEKKNPFAGSERPRPQGPASRKAQQMQQTQQSQYTQEMLNNPFPLYPLIQQPAHPAFMANYNKAMNTLNAQNAGEFFRNFLGFLAARPSPSLLAMTLKPLLQRADSDPGVFQKLLEAGVPVQIPTSDPLVRPAVLWLCMKMTAAYPQMLTEGILSKLTQCVGEYGENVLKILYPCLRVLDRLPNVCWFIIDFLLRFQGDFIKQCGVLFMKMLYQVLNRFPQVRENKQQEVTTILVAAAQFGDPKCASTAYRMMAQFGDPAMTVKAETLAAHIANETTRRDALAFLARQKFNPTSVEVLKALVAAAKDEELAVYCLLNEVVSRPDSCAYVLTECDFIKKLKPVDALSVLLIACSNPETRARAAQSEHVAMFVSSMLNNGDPSFAILAAQIAFKLIEKPEAVILLARSEFFLKFGELATENQELRPALLAVVDAVSRIAFVHDFLPYLPIIIEKVDKSSLSALAAMSFHPNAKQAMRSAGVVNKVSAVAGQPEVSEYVNIITNNLN